MKGFGRPFMKSIEKKEMSVQKPQSTVVLHNYNQKIVKQSTGLTTPFSGTGALVQQRFAFNLKQQDPDSTQSGILLKFTIPAYAGQRKRFLKIRKCQINYVNYYDDNYPCHYSICANQVSGILNKDGSSSKQLAILPLQQLGTNITNDFMTLNLLYQTQDKDQYLYDITGISTLNFFLAEQMSPTALPTPLASHLLLQISVFRSLVGVIVVTPTSPPSTGGIKKK